MRHSNDLIPDCKHLSCSQHLASSRHEISPTENACLERQPKSITQGSDILRGGQHCPKHKGPECKVFAYDGLRQRLGIGAGWLMAARVLRAQTLSPIPSKYNLGPLDARSCTRCHKRLRFTNVEIDIDPLHKDRLLLVLKAGGPFSPGTMRTLSLTACSLQKGCRAINMHSKNEHLPALSISESSAMFSVKFGDSSS